MCSVGRRRFAQRPEKRKRKTQKEKSHPRIVYRWWRNPLLPWSAQIFCVVPQITRRNRMYFPGPSIDHNSAGVCRPSDSLATPPSSCCFRSYSTSTHGHRSAARNISPTTHSNHTHLASFQLACAALLLPFFLNARSRTNAAYNAGNFHLCL